MERRTKKARYAGRRKIIFFRSFFLLFPLFFLFLPISFSFSFFFHFLVSFSFLKVSAQKLSSLNYQSEKACSYLYLLIGSSSYVKYIYIYPLLYPLLYTHTHIHIHPFIIVMIEKKMRKVFYDEVSEIDRFEKRSWICILYMNKVYITMYILEKS